MAALAMLSCARACPRNQTPPIPGQPAASLPAPTLGGRIALQGAAGDDDFALLAQPTLTGGDLEGVYRIGTLGPIPLRGVREGAHVHLKEFAAGGAIDGDLDAKSHFRGTLRRGDKPPLRIDAAPNVPFGGRTERAFAFVASRADGFALRGQLTLSRGQITGLWRERGSEDAQAIDGRFDAASGAFVLRASGSHGVASGVEGAFLDADLALGRFTSQGGAPGGLSVRFDGAADLPATAELGEGRRAVARWEAERIPPGCTRDLAWPHFIGIPEAAAERLDALLDPAARGIRRDGRCEAGQGERPTSDSLTYRIGPHSFRAAAIELERASYGGGAHGSRSLTCLVADLIDGRVIAPSTLVTLAGRPALANLVTNELRAQRKTPDLTKAGFFFDPVPFDGAELCLRDGALYLVFREYSIAPYSTGQPWARLPAAAVLPLLSRDAAVDSLLPVK